MRARSTKARATNLTKMSSEKITSVRTDTATERSASRGRPCDDYRSCSPPEESAGPAVRGRSEPRFHDRPGRRSRSRCRQCFQSCSGNCSRGRPAYRPLSRSPRPGKPRAKDVGSQDVCFAVGKADSSLSPSQFSTHPQSQRCETRRGKSRRRTGPHRARHPAQLKASIDFR
jgi:hypothetical protein